MTHPENWTTKTQTERDEAVVQRLLDAGEQDKALEVARARGSQVWVADDGNADVAYEVENRSEAAEAYVEEGDWGDDRATTSWVTIYTWPRYVVGSVEVDDLDDRDGSTVEIAAEVPECTETEHDWCAPYEILGGLEENPGVWGHGGGVICKEVCRHCGCLKVTDTWAQNPENGEQGLCSESYQELDDHDYSDDWREWHAEQ